MALWGGRFSGKTHELVAKLSESVSFDRRLYAHDIQATIAHVRMLGRQRIIPAEDADRITTELGKIKEEIERGDFEFSEEFEDIHMNIEARLLERLGDAGARVHTARSRNDQVATDIRLYLRDEIDEIAAGLRELQAALVELADQNREAILPGYTHMQHAQPVLFAHHLLAYVEMCERDQGRLTDARKRLNVLPLGAGALAGTSLPIDREYVAEQLGFDGVMQNSMDAVSDRDFAIELLADLALIMQHLSRLAEDLIFWNSPEAAFIKLGDEFCTGSSLMPQKKNPDVAELTRGKTGRVYGALTALLTVMKGLPLAYNRDMQEDKEQLFDAVDTVKLVLAAFAPMLSSVTVNAENMLAAASDPALMATDLAESLVEQGLSFRTAHEQVGKLVAWCEAEGKALNQVSLEEMRAIIPEAGAACLGLFNPKRSVAARSHTGGTAPDQVQRQLASWKKKLSSG